LIEEEKILNNNDNENKEHENDVINFYNNKLKKILNNKEKK
jgi:hypothetical protein